MNLLDHPDGSFFLAAIALLAVFAAVFVVFVLPCIGEVFSELRRGGRGSGRRSTWR
ncbi:MAG: hypothetical protein ACAI25_12025 [Planctomycetota bacterium]